MKKKGVAVIIFNNFLFFCSLYCVCEAKDANKLIKTEMPRGNEEITRNSVENIVAIYDWKEE